MNFLQFTVSFGFSISALDIKRFYKNLRALKMGVFERLLTAIDISRKAEKSGGQSQENVDFQHFLKIKFYLVDKRAEESE